MIRDDRRPSRDQCFLLPASHALDAMFQSQRFTALTGRTFEYQFDRHATAQILRAARTAAMLPQPAFDIQRDAGIQAVVGASQDIDRVGHQDGASFRKTRRVDAGYFSSKAAGLIGRRFRIL